VAARAYALTMSLAPTKSPASGFQLYFLIPLILSWLLLWTEGADHSKPGRPFVEVFAPFLLRLLAFPGPGTSVAQVRYLDLLGDSIGSPIQVTAALLIVYFGVSWARRR